MNKIKLVIPVHSFVDLITNSSSEIFTSATEATVQTVKDIIAGILKTAGSKKTADDLFNVSRSFVVRNSATNHSEMAFDTAEERDEFLKSCGLESGDSGDEGDSRWSNLVVFAKDSNDADAVATANKLANLFGTYNTWEEYN